MKKKIYVSPSAGRKKGYPNRYFVLLKQQLASFFEVLDSENKPCLAQGLSLLRFSFKADIFLLSFVETVAFQKLAFLQFLLAHLSLLIMRIRGRKVAFIFHNPRPHKGENFMSESLTKAQLVHSCLVISHSEETAALARKKISEYGGDPSKVKFVPHPVVKMEAAPKVPSDQSDFILLWGNILPYKGILEFVSSPAVRSAGLKVKIVGACQDPRLLSSIETAVNRGGCSTSFCFENRSAGFEELGSLIAGSRHVLFPYLTGSVSSSGALMDTIAMGGDAIGPNVGAFADLAEEGVCSVYDSEDEMIRILRSDRMTGRSAMDDFIDRNSWRSYAQRIATWLNI